MAMTEYWVSAAVGADTGAGTSFGDPMGAADGDPVQRLLDSGLTLDATDGNIIYLIDDGTYTPSAALDFTAFGTPATTAPVWLIGTHSDGSTASDLATDTGIADINLGGGAFIYVTGVAVSVRFLHIRNSTVPAVDMGSNSTIVDCEVSDIADDGIDLDSYGTAVNCYVHNCSGVGIRSASTASTTYNCYVRSRTTDSQGAMTTGIVGAGNRSNVRGCCVSVEGATSGLVVNTTSHHCVGNSVLSYAGSGIGIDIVDAAISAHCHSNIVEGFSSAGTGINYGSGASPSAIIGNNKVYNCATKWSATIPPAGVYLPDTLLTKTPFLKSGADTFANRANYFAPRDTGGILGGAF